MSDISEAYHDIFYGDGDEFIDPTKDCGHEDACYDCPEDFSGEDLTSYDCYNRYGVCIGTQIGEEFGPVEECFVYESIHKLFLKKLKNEIDVDDNILLIFNELIDDYPYISNMMMTLEALESTERKIADNIVNIIEEASKVNPTELMNHFFDTLSNAQKIIEEHQEDIDGKLYNIFSFVDGKDVKILPDYELYKSICRWCILASLSKYTFKQVLREYKYFQHRTYIGPFKKGLNTNFWNAWHDHKDVDVINKMIGHNKNEQELEKLRVKSSSTQSDLSRVFGSDTPPNEEIPF
jgi:hypothetical protein